MINQYIVTGIFGFVGGIASGFVGVFAGLLYDTNYKLTLIAGYASTDLIEGIYKIKNPKSNLGFIETNL